MYHHQNLARHHRAAGSDRVQTLAETIDTKSFLSSHTSTADTAVPGH